MLNHRCNNSTKISISYEVNILPFSEIGNETYSNGQQIILEKNRTFTVFFGIPVYSGNILPFCYYTCFATVKVLMKPAFFVIRQKKEVILSVFTKCNFNLSSNLLRNMQRFQPFLMSPKQANMWPAVCR